MKILGNCIYTGYLNTSEPMIHCDLTDTDSANSFLKKTKPKIIIHTVAITDVDACQRDASLAYKVNVNSTKNITQWILNYSPETYFIFISSDQVYSGEGPHNEKNAHPLNIYALTKLHAEDISLSVSNSLVLRTNFFSPSKNKGLVKWIVDSVNNGYKIKLFDDVWFNPLYVEDLADLIILVCEKQLTGVYNIGANDSISKGSFVRSVVEYLGLSRAIMTNSSVHDVVLDAPRPNDMRMCVDKLSSKLNIILPSIEEGLGRLSIEYRR